MLSLWLQNCVASVLDPVGASSRVAVSSVTTARNTSADAGTTSPGSDQRQRHPAQHRESRTAAQPRSSATSSSTGGVCASDAPDADHRAQA